MKTKSLALTASALLACCCLNVKAQEKTPPNVVFILADDLGINDVAAFACHFTGRKSEELFYETPHLDKLVSKGICSCTAELGSVLV